MGASTVAIAIVAILIIAAAGAGVYYLTKNTGGGGESDEGATFEDPGIGTVMKYKVTSPDSSGTGSMTFTYVAENTTSKVARLQLEISGEGSSLKTDTFGSPRNRVEMQL